MNEAGAMQNAFRLPLTIILGATIVDLAWTMFNADHQLMDVVFYECGIHY